MKSELIGKLTTQSISLQFVTGVCTRKLRRGKKAWKLGSKCSVVEIVFSKCKEKSTVLWTVMPAVRGNLRVLEEHIFSTFRVEVKTKQTQFLLLLLGHNIASTSESLQTTGQHNAKYRDPQWHCRENLKCSN
jgi:hypothetical protein